MAKQKPAHEIRLGKIKATIWANDTANGTLYEVTISRVHREGDDWKQSDSSGRDDLPVVAKVLDLAHTWILKQGGQPQ